MSSFFRDRPVHALALVISALLIPLADSAACEVRTLVEALSQVSVSTPRAASRKPFQAAPLSEAELAAMPALASTESLLRRVGLPLTWHRMDSAMVDAALDAGGGTLIVAAGKAEGGQSQCQVLTRDSAAGTQLRAQQATVLALLPLRESNASDEGFSVHDAVRGMVADFRLAMRVGTQYAPQGAWVISPWLTEARLRRSALVALAATETSKA